jgi:hypothetical protein
MATHEPDEIVPAAKLASFTTPVIAGTLGARGAKPRESLKIVPRPVPPTVPPNSVVP